MTQIPIESMNLMMLNVGRAQHNADWNWQDVSSPFIRIFYVTEGEATLHLPAGSLTLRPGHLYIIPAYTAHSYECHGRFTVYYLHMYEGFKRELNLQEVYELPTEVEAGVAKVTKPYFIKLFKREFGSSPVQYINIKKVERAQLLLFTTDKTVKEVAYKLGFSDQNY